MPSSPRALGTYAGVFRPVFLTILGALFYLREGWLVGNAGLLGAVLVIVVSTGITGLTSLSVSSIATNVRVRAGGAFALISAALGIDVGGAVGVPLYLAQTLSAVLYVYAFSEAWGVLFPTHSGQIVAMIAMAVLGAVTLRSVALAARVQGGMMVVVLLAIGSVFAGWMSAETLVKPVWIGSFQEASLLQCFVVFFPAATGIMVGVGMSGDLENPSVSVPRGTLAAWGVTTFVYLLGAVWYATIAPTDVLLGGELTARTHALWGPVVLFGLFTSTLMAALSSLVAAPRLLQAMAEYQVVPFAAWLAATDEDGTPSHATWVSIGIAALGLFAGSLNALAPLITGIFVTTFLVINLAVLLEELVGMISWRPLFRVGVVVPALGVLVCVLTLGVSSPLGGLPEIGAVLALYLWLARLRQVDTPWETVQSGLVQTLAYRAALRALTLTPSERSWRPDLLVRLTGEAEDLGLWERLVAHHGSLKIATAEYEAEAVEHGRELVEALRRRGVLASQHLLDLTHPAKALDQALGAFQGVVGAPTTLAVRLRDLDDEALAALLVTVQHRKVGFLLVDGKVPPLHQVNIWVSPRSPDWPLEQHMANLDLQVLAGLLLTQAGGQLHLVTVVPNRKEEQAARRFFQALIELGRLRGASFEVRVGAFGEQLTTVPADLQIFGLSAAPTVEELRVQSQQVQGACLFVQKSGMESVLV